MSYLFSPSNISFYPVAIKAAYINAGTLPDDVIEVDDAVFSEFSATPSDGFTRGVKNGMPAWVDVPPPSQLDLIAAANREKSRRLSASNIFITPLQDAFDMEMATDQEQDLLLAWKKYRVQLSRVNTSTAPNIEWPTQPGEPAN